MSGLNKLKSFTYNVILPKIQAVSDELNLKEPNTVLISSDSGTVASSEVSTTELGHLNNVTDKIQTQLDSGNVSMVNTSNELVLRIQNVSPDLTLGISTVSDSIFEYLNVDSMPNGTNGKYIENGFYYGDLNISGNLVVTNYSANGTSTSILSSTIDNVSEIVSMSLEGPVLKINEKAQNNIMELSHGTEMMVTMLHDGKLGIGKSAPVATVDVAGNVKASGAINGVTAQSLGYLSGVTDNIQTQIDNHAAAISAASQSSVGNLNYSTSSNMTNAISNMSNHMVSELSTSSRDVSNYITDVTDQKQDVINFSKTFVRGLDNSISVKDTIWDVNANNISYSSSVFGPTVNVYSDKVMIDTLQAALVSDVDNKQDIITGAATTIMTDSLTANKIVVSDANGKVSTHSATSAELEHLANVTTSIQGQIDGIPTNIATVESDLTIQRDTEYNNMTDYVNSVISDELAKTAGKQSAITSVSGGTLSKAGNVISYTLSASDIDNLVQEQSYWTKAAPSDNFISYSNVLISVDNISTKITQVFQEPHIVDSGIVKDNTSFVNVGDNQYIYSFTNSSNDEHSITFPQDTVVDVLIVGGGGSGGHGGNGDEGVGGGGGGGSVYVASSVAVPANTKFPIVVGKGGVAAFGENGGDSSVFGITAAGGGAGGNSDAINGMALGTGGGGGINLYTSNVGLGGAVTDKTGADGAILNIGDEGLGGYMEFPRQNMDADTFTYTDGIVVECKASTVYSSDVSYSPYKLFDGHANTFQDSQERIYPPIDLTTLTDTISGQRYGNGQYIVSSGDGYTHGWKLFSDADAYSVGPWHAGQYYVNWIPGTGYIVSDFTAHWIKIQLPVKIKLTKYTFIGGAPPGKYKIYASNDDDMWYEIVSATLTPGDYVNDTFNENVNVNQYFKYFALAIKTAAYPGNTQRPSLNRWNLYGKEAFELEQYSWFSGIDSGTGETYDESGNALVTYKSEYPGEWVMVDLGEDVIVRQTKLYPLTTQLTRQPKEFRIYGTNDGTAFSSGNLNDNQWNLLYNGVNSTEITFTENNPNYIAAKYPRYPLTGDTTTYPDGSGTVVRLTSSSQYDTGANSRFGSFNHNTSDYGWASETDSYDPATGESVSSSYKNGYDGSYITIDLGERILLDNIKIYPRIDSGNNPYRRPKEFRIYASNSLTSYDDINDSNWTLIFEGHNTNDGSGTTPHEYTINSSVGYKYYAFVINKIFIKADSNSVQFAELEFYSKASQIISSIPLFVQPTITYERLDTTSIRKYPPVGLAPTGNYDTVSFGDMTVLSGNSVSITKSKDDIGYFSYGSGTYEISWSSWYDNGVSRRQPLHVFDGVSIDGDNTGRFDDLQYSATAPYEYIGSDAGINGYTGDWVKLKLPKAIWLSHFVITGSTVPNDFQNAKDFKVFGRKDEASPWIEVLSGTATYTNNVYTSTSRDVVNNRESYIEYALVVNTIIGNLQALMIVELEFYGSENGQLFEPVQLATTGEYFYDFTKTYDLVKYPCENMTGYTKTYADGITIVKCRASSEFSNDNTAWRAFDGTPYSSTSRWSTAGWYNSGTINANRSDFYFNTHSTFYGEYIILDLGQEIVLNHYIHYGFNGYINRSPVDFRMYATNDSSAYLDTKSTNWIQIDERIGTTGYADNTGKTFTLATTPDAYRYFAIIVNKIGNDSYLEFSELELYGYPAHVNTNYSVQFPQDTDVQLLTNIDGAVIDNVSFSKDITYQIQLDASGTWEILDDSTVVTSGTYENIIVKWNVPVYPVTYDLSNNVIPYRYYAMVINKIYTNGLFVQFAEWELLGNKIGNFGGGGGGAGGNAVVIYMDTIKSDHFGYDTSDMLVWYRFQGNLDDSSGRNNNLIDSGTEIALEFPAGNKCLNVKNGYVQNSQLFDMGSDAGFTISFWYYATSNRSQIPFTISYGSYNFNVDLANSSLGWTLSTSIPGGTWNSGGGYTGRWTHMTYTFSKNSNSCKLYFDGVLFSSIDQFTYPPSVASPDGYSVRIGQFDGWIDDFRMYNRNLSSAEIVDVYNFKRDTYYSGFNDSLQTIINLNLFPIGGKGTSSHFGDDITDLVAWYKFERNVKDSSGNHRDLCINSNAMLETNGSFSITGNGCINVKSGSLQNTVPFDLGSDAGFTISFWYYATSNRSQIPFTISYGSYNFSVSLGNSSLGWNLTTDISGVTWNSGGGYTGRWTHMTYTFSKNPNSCKLYFDGVLFSSIDQFTYPPSVASPDGYSVRIGQFDGWIDDFRMYNRNLSSAEIVDVYNYKNIDTFYGAGGSGGSMNYSGYGGGHGTNIGAYDNVNGGNGVANTGGGGGGAKTGGVGGDGGSGLVVVKWYADDKITFTNIVTQDELVNKQDTLTFGQGLSYDAPTNTLALTDTPLWKDEGSHVSYGNVKVYDNKITIGSKLRPNSVIGEIKVFPPALLVFDSADINQVNAVDKIAKTTLSGQQYASGEYIVEWSSDSYGAYGYQAFTGGIPHSGGGTYNSATSISTYTNRYIVSNYWGEWIKIKLPVAIYLKYVTLVPRGGHQARFPVDYKIYGTNNGNDWTELIHQNDTTYFGSTSVQKSPDNDIIFQKFHTFAIVVNKIFNAGSNNSNFYNFSGLSLYGTEYVTTTETKNFLKDTSDMYVWYKFNGDFKDDSGYGRDAIAFNTPTFDESLKKEGTHSVSFAGDAAGTDSQYLTVPSTDFSLWDGFTVSCWVMFEDNASYARIIDFGDGQANNGMVFARNTGGNKLLMHMYHGTTISDLFATTNDVIVDNTWMHVAWTITKVPSWKLYVNGVSQQLNSGTFKYPVSATYTNCYIAKSNSAADPYFKGKMDDFRIYKRALVAEEVEILYNGTMPTYSTGELYVNTVRAKEITTLGASPQMQIGNHISVAKDTQQTGILKGSYMQSPTMTGTYTQSSFYSQEDNEMYEYAEFTDDGTIIFPQDTVCDILLVGGGGSGRIDKGGGSSGGILYATNQPIFAGTYPITVGSGGVNRNGGDTSAFGATAKGGLKATTATGATNNGANIPGTTVAVWNENKVALAGGTAFEPIVREYPRHALTGGYASNYIYTAATVNSLTYRVRAASGYSGATDYGKMRDLFNKNISDSGWFFNSGRISTTVRRTLGGDYAGEYIMIDLVNAVILDNFVLYPTSGYSGRSPRYFRLYATNTDDGFTGADGASTGVNHPDWTLIYERTSDMDTGGATPDGINFPTTANPITINTNTITTAYRYYMIIVNTNWGDGWGKQIAEWTLNGKEIVQSAAAGGGGVGSVGESATTSASAPSGGEGFPVSIRTPNELFAGGGGANGGTRVPATGNTIGYGGNSTTNTITNPINFLCNSTVNDGITTTINTEITAIFDKTRNNISTSTELYATNDMVGRCTTKLQSGVYGCLFEGGATGDGVYLGLRQDAVEGTILRLRAGHGDTSYTYTQGLTHTNARMALLDIPYTGGFEKYDDGETHELVWEVRIGKDSTYSGRVRIWIDGELMGTATTYGTNNRMGINGAKWAGPDSGSFGKKPNSVCAGESATEWPLLTDLSSMDYYRNRLVSEDQLTTMDYSVVNGGNGIAIVRWKKPDNNISSILGNNMRILKTVQNFAAFFKQPTLMNATNNEIVEIPGNTPDEKYFYTTFTDTTTPGSITFDQDTECDVLIVGGGGGGGNFNQGKTTGSTGSLKGGGGAGAYQYIEGINFQGTYSIIVGEGGPISTKGGDSKISKDGIDIYISEGGGSGGTPGSDSGSGGNGGSGGGGNFGYTGGIANDPSKGNDGAAGTIDGGVLKGGGGGGAGTAGNLSNGGDGLPNSITGIEKYYAGGGGGGVNGTRGTGGLGGGGKGCGPGITASAGQANTGGGGGGGMLSGFTGGAAGGSGIVIIRWKNPSFLKFDTVFSQPTIANATNNQIMKHPTDKAYYSTFTDTTVDGSITFEQDTVCDILIVGGGGAGGVGKGGGSSGGILYATNQLIPTGIYPITVGAGGTVDVNGNGGDSVAFGATAKGGLQATAATGATNNGANIPGTTVAVWDKDSGALAGGYSFVIEYTEVRKYPPTGLTGGTVSNMSVTKTPSGAPSYGTGNYIISWSSQFSTSSYIPSDVFDGGTGGIGGSWSESLSLYSNGTYLGTSAINGYKGDWIKIQLPVSIHLSSVKMYQRSGYERAPVDFKVFGTNDGTNWIEVISKIGAIYTSLQFETSINDIVADNNNIAYNQYVLVANKLGTHKGSVLNFTELELYGSEAILSTPSGGGGVGSAGGSPTTYTEVREYPRHALSGGSASNYIYTAATVNSLTYRVRVASGYSGATNSSVMMNLFNKNISDSGWFFNSGRISTTVRRTLGGYYAGEYIMIDLVNAVILDNFVLYPSGSSGRSPRYFRLYATNTDDGFTGADGASTGVNHPDWTLIYERTSAMDTGGATPDGINFPTTANPITINTNTITTAYRYYMIIVNTNWGNSWGKEIAEWTLNGKEIVQSTPTDSPNGGEGFPVSIRTPNELFAGGGGVNGGTRVPPGNTIGYGGNSTETTAEDGGGGIVIIKWYPDKKVVYDSQEYCLRTKRNIWMDSANVIWTSDIRIKKEVQDIDDDSALEQVLLLEPKTYKYKNALERGNNKVFGFISQQVEDVIPEATTKTTNFIPNVYQHCEYTNEIVNNIPNSTIMLPSDYDIATLSVAMNSSNISTKVRLMNEKSESAELDFVLTSNVSGYGLMTEDISDFTDNSSNVFVFGTQVEDMTTIDKSYLYTLNVCATQVLSRKIDTLEASNSAMMARIEQLESELDILQNSFNN